MFACSLLVHPVVLAVHLVVLAVHLVVLASKAIESQLLSLKTDHQTPQDFGTHRLAVMASANLEQLVQQCHYCLVHQLRPLGSMIEPSACCTAQSLPSLSSESQVAHRNPYPSAAYLVVPSLPLATFSRFPKLVEEPTILMPLAGSLTFVSFEFRIADFVEDLVHRMQPPGTARATV